MATQLNVRPLTNQEQAASGYTHEAVIKAGTDLTESTANTSMVFNLFKTQAGDVMEKAHLHLFPAFKDASDAAFNSDTMSFGDEDLATRFFSAVQTNENGTEVIDSFENTAYGPYTGVKQITWTVNSMAAKKLSDLDVGKAILLFKLNRGAVALEAGAA
jgi:hypothetical protein